MTQSKALIVCRRGSKAGALTLAALLPFCSTSCGPKTTKIEVPPKISQAKSASFQELVRLVDHTYAQPIRALKISSLRVKAEGVEKAKQLLKQYPRGSGYMVLSRPSLIHFNINNPLTHTTIADMVSNGQIFQIFVPSENKFITGSTSIQRIEDNPFYNIRPQHVVAAILIEPLLERVADGKIFLRETEDEQAKYYVLSVLRDNPGDRIRLHREVFIERSQMVLHRQIYYQGDGVAITDIRYDRWSVVGPNRVASYVQLNRPQDGYKLIFELEPRSIEVNAEVEPSMFRLTQPPGSELVEVKEKVPGS